jgi:hypothetical protein
MEIIVFEKDAYYRMLAEIKKTIKEALNETRGESAELSTEKWIDGKAAQVILKCKCDKLRQLRNTEKIKASLNGRKILYYKPSLFEFIENNTNSYYHETRRK